MAMNPRLLRPAANDSPASIPGLALWLDASASDALYTTDAGPVSAVSSPLDISGCVGWWDASDASSITESGGSVSQINDKSELAAHASQGTAGARPTLIASALNGRSVLRFDGGDALTGNFASAITTNAYSVFAVCKESTVVTNGRVFSAAPAAAVDFASGSVIPCCNNGGAAGALSAFDGAAGTNRSAVTGFSNYAVFGGVCGSSSVENSGNGMRAASSSVTLSASLARFGIGAPAQGGPGGWNGDIAEVIFYSTALTASQRASVEAYLAAKWGISGVHAPAVTASDPVGYWRDRSGNGRHATQSTAASRPRVASASVNGRRVAEWHSSTSLMQIAGAGALANTMSMFAVAKRGPSNWGGGGGGGYGAILSIGSSSSGPAMRAANGVIGMLGGTNESTFAPSGGLGVTAHALFGGTLNSLASSLYVNGALVDSDAAAGSVGGAANTAIGAFSATTGGGGPLNAELAEIISYNRLLSTAERRKVEVYLARRWGITLAPQVSNAEAQDWVNRVYANGDTVSQSTANAVSAMCDAIESAGIRDRFYRLNLLCGDNLNAALVPLYRGPTFGGTTYGNATDTNNGPFVSGDYVETNGLRATADGAAATNKYLNTGFLYASIPSYLDSHIAAEIKTIAGSSIAASQWLSGGLINSDPLAVQTHQYRLLAGAPATSGYSENTIVGATAEITRQNVAIGSRRHLVSSRTSSSLLDFYANGGSKASSTALISTSLTPSASSPMILFGYVNGANPVPQFKHTVANYSIGLGMSEQQVAAYYSAVQQFNSALGRT